jgi:hypothetical protein
MARVFLRVNGIGISRAWVRNRLEDGSPFGRPEVVIEVPSTENLPGLGEITLVDRRSSGLPDFKVEIRRSGEKEWKDITPGELASLLAGSPHGQETGP